MSRPVTDTLFDACYPVPVPPSESVEAARGMRQREMISIARMGILVRMVIILVELLGVVISQSRVLLVDAVASVFDVVASMVLIAAIQFASRPPDDDHPFGHGRAEPLAGFQLAILLCGTGLWLAAKSFWDLTQPGLVWELPGWIWLIPLSSALLLLVVAARISLVARKNGSAALQSEAVHYQIDAWTSLMAAAALLIAVWFPEWSISVDRLGGGLLALLVMGLGAYAARQNLHQILDRVPHPEDFQRVKTSALAVPGVIDVEKIRIQHAGPDAHVDIDIEVEPRMTVAESHLITQQVRARIQTDWPFVREVVVHVEPYYQGDH